MVAAFGPNAETSSTHNKTKPAQQTSMTINREPNKTEERRTEQNRPVAPIGR